jgi:hypothetical protein
MSEKYILLSECIARLPYTLWIKDENGDDISVNNKDVNFEEFCEAILAGKVIPYLRSLDTMTEAEEKQFNKDSTFRKQSSSEQELFEKIKNLPIEELNTLIDTIFNIENPKSTHARR